MELLHIRAAGGSLSEIKLCRKKSWKLCRTHSGFYFALTNEAGCSSSAWTRGKALDRSDSGHADISINFPEAHKAHCWAHHSTHKQGKMTWEIVNDLHLQQQFAKHSKEGIFLKKSRNQTEIVLRRVMIILQAKRDS